MQKNSSLQNDEVLGTVCSVLPLDDADDPALERVIMCAISADEISVRLPVKCTQNRLSKDETLELLNQMAEIALQRLRGLHI